MENVKEASDFPTMAMRRIAGQKEISAQIARKVAEMIVIEDCGEAVLNAQQPIAVSSDGDFWLAVGSRNESLEALARQSPDSVGILHLKMSQFDGQIVDLHYEAANNSRSPPSSAVK